MAASSRGGGRGERRDPLNAHLGALPDSAVELMRAVFLAWQEWLSSKNWTRAEEELGENIVCL